jgi:hypothetical protein
MKLNTDRIVSLSAMVVGLGSLFTIVYQTYLTREAQHASVMPYLMVDLNSNEQGVFIVLTNNGIGPALIEDIRVRYQGREIEGDPYTFYLGLRGDSALDVNQITPGRLVPAGAAIPMVGVPGRGPHSQTFARDVLRLFEIAEVPRSWYVGAGAAGPDKAVIEIVYASVYGERWRLRSDRMVPEHL